MPKCFQINAKTYPKSYQISVRSNSKKHVFAWKVLQKSRFRSPWTLAKRHQIPLKNQLTKSINFLMDFEWFLEACWHHFPLKIVTIIQSKTNAFFIRKINDNWCQNGLIWEARGGSNEPAFRSLNLCWGRPGAQGDPRALQGRPGHRPGSQHFPKWSSKCSNNDPKTTREIPNYKQKHWKNNVKMHQNTHTHIHPHSQADPIEPANKFHHWGTVAGLPKAIGIFLIHD